MQDCTLFLEGNRTLNSAVKISEYNMRNKKRINVFHLSEETLKMFYNKALILYMQYTHIQWI